MREFHATYYVPNNATLVLVGDFETKQAQAAGRAVSRPRAARASRCRATFPKEPPHNGGERVHGDRAAGRCRPSSSSHHITHDGHPDAYPLHILAKILSDGDSSRIYRSLVYEKQIALAAFGEAKLIEHPNLFYAVAIVQPGSSRQTC